MNLDSLKKAMKGVFVVETTPFNKDDSMDLDGMRENTRWLVEFGKGKDFAIVPVGSTGEFYALSTDENKVIIKMVVKEVNGSLPVIAGGGRAGTRETIKICQYAESVGADGVQVILPYYHIPEEEGLFLHFKELAESIKIGIIIYNNPAPTGSWIKPSLMAKLAKIPNVIAVKENTPDIRAYYKMVRTIDPKDLTIICGIGEQMFSFESLYGCPGFVTSLANFAPGLSYSVYEAAVRRDFDKMRSLNDLLAPYFDFLNQAVINHGPHVGIAGASIQAGYMYLAVIKAAMDMLGLRGGEVRLPLIGLNNNEKGELREILRGMKLL
jgi:4-hydroxy-tetrahydrodipicolinate synthase